ncbi:serine threonine- kinase pim-2-like protein [Labeo rohita]|uniref:Serine threonine-kinase pim-2-like protein n=1 Tax=Labeo rohita TaxID=84645 RepID=A0A498LIE0_LABRO|nr:serine threonine- kinase pim-2-like protein [Labeo rohita]
MVEIVKSAKECAEHGVCHLDMHVYNVMVDAASLKVKLIDFGGGKRIGEPDENTDPETRIPLQEAINEMMYSLGQLLGWLVRSKDKSIPEDIAVGLCSAGTKMLLQFISVYSCFLTFDMFLNIPFKIRCLAKSKQILIYCESSIVTDRFLEPVDSCSQQNTNSTNTKNNTNPCSQT